VQVPIEQFGGMDGDIYEMHDLLADVRYTWRGSRNFVALDPHVQPAHVFRLRRWTGDKFV
jgi:starch synthase (maltosyl-transferring)